MGATSGLVRDGLVAAVLSKIVAGPTTPVPDPDINPLVRGLLAPVPADVHSLAYDGALANRTFRALGSWI